MSSCASTEIDENLSETFSNDESDAEKVPKFDLFPREKSRFSSEFKSPLDFTSHSSIFEQIVEAFSRAESEQWSSLFKNAIQQSDRPIVTLYMFLDRIVDKVRDKKHQLLTGMIEQYKTIELDPEKETVLSDDQIKLNVLAKICRRCAPNHIEPIIDVFQLNSTENRAWIREFIKNSLEHNRNLQFVAQIALFFHFIDAQDGIPFEEIVVRLISENRWDSIRFVVGENVELQRKCVNLIDALISSDRQSVRDVLNDLNVSINVFRVEKKSLRRVGKKFIRQFDFRLDEFPNLAKEEKLSLLNNLFVQKYLKKNEENDEEWNEKVKNLIGENEDLKRIFVDLFVDYIDVDSGVRWAEFYKLEDSQIPEQIRIRREQIKTGIPQSFDEQNEKKHFEPEQKEDFYSTNISVEQIFYVEMDSELENFFRRLECSQRDVGSNLPFVGFDCEMFTDPNLNTFDAQIVSIFQFSIYQNCRKEFFDAILDMNALRLQLDLSNLSDFSQRIFSSKDFFLLTYDYAGDSSSLIENFPSMTEALLNGNAVVDLSIVQEHILEKFPQIFPFHDDSSEKKARGLSELTRLCFGRVLDKSMQTSDWRRRPLRKEQLIYGVLDARVLVDIALFIDERTRQLDIPWSWSNFKGYHWTQKALNKRLSQQKLSMKHLQSS